MDRLRSTLRDSRIIGFDVSVAVGEIEYDGIFARILSEELRRRL
jgi:hypothetical protein